jgi:hypothetical protein
MYSFRGDGLGLYLATNIYRVISLMIHVSYVTYPRIELQATYRNGSSPTPLRGISMMDTIIVQHQKLGTLYARPRELNLVATDLSGGSCVLGMH